MLFIVGLGIGKFCFDDISEIGLKAIKNVSELYLLSSLYHPCHQQSLEEYLSLKCTLIQPNMLAELVEDFQSKSKDVALVTPGNPFCDNLFPLISSLCSKYNISYKVIHSSSYMNAIGNTGIQMYKIGETLFVDNLDQDIQRCLQVAKFNAERSLNTLVIFNKHSTENHALGFLKALAVPSTAQDSALKDVEVVGLYRTADSAELLFDNGTVEYMTGICSSNNLEALCICCELDCIEQEYLQKAKAYQDDRLKGSPRCGVFSVIGLGLGSPEDITVKGRRLIEKSQKVFLEGYTSIMIGGCESLEKFHGKEIIVADREMVEQNSDEILKYLDKGENVSFLVVGDPLGATTHTDIIIRALEKNSDVVIANNTSIINAFGASGLKPSKFGGIVSIPFWTDVYKPASFYDKISSNLEMGWHTLCLLDIQVKEQSFENLARGRKIYEKPRYMSPNVASQQLLECKKLREKEDQKCLVHEDTRAIALSRVGTESEQIKISTLGELVECELGPPLHSLIIVGDMDEDEYKSSIK